LGAEAFLTCCTECKVCDTMYFQQAGGLENRQMQTHSDTYKA